MSTGDELWRSDRQTHANPGRGFLDPSRVIDVSVTAIFFLIALGVYYARGGFRPTVVNLTSDAATIATMAAAQDYPENFKADSVFSSPTPSRFYVAFHVPATRLLNRIFHDYGKAFTFLLLPTMFLYLVGFYYLGTQWFGSRGLATALAFVNLVLVKGPRDTAWGPFKDALPRFDHAVLFAFLLALIWRWRERPWLWPLLFLGAGLGVYVHPVSTPAMGAMLLGASVALAVSSGSWRRFVIPIGFGSLLFMLALLPFALPFTLNSASAATGLALSPDELRELAEIIEERFTGHYLSPARTVQEYLARPYMAFVFLPALVAGGCVMWGFGSRDDRVKVIFLVGVLFGLISSAAIFPMVIELATDPWELAVFKGELPRPLRYLIPVTYLCAFSALSLLWKSAIAKQRWLTFSLVGIVVLGGVVAVFPRASRAARAALSAGHADRPVAELVKAVEIYCNPKFAILPVMEDPLVLRYSALRPLAFTYKDVPAFTNLSEAVKWRKNRDTLRKTLRIHDPYARVRAAREWAEFLQVQYVVVEKPIPSALANPALGDDWQVVFENVRFLVLIRTSFE